MRILVVDDEPAVREAVDRALRLQGYETELAADGAEALAERAPDALALDVLMPRVDGLEVCRRLRAAGDRTPVLVLIARDAVPDRVRGLDAGADDYLVKPFALEPFALAPALDSAALIGFPAAEELLGADASASTIYVRAAPDDIEAVRELVGQTANPARPEEVEVSRPSDALEARAAAKTAFTSLFLGLGAVALLVGGVGIANVMVISVLERRSEVGLRRALGATRRNVGTQFLTESLLLAAGGGLAGVALGAVAGLYPALRAARLSPTEALRSV